MRKKNKRTMRKKNKNKISWATVQTIFLYIVCISMLVFGAKGIIKYDEIFYKGYHNLDQCQNLRWINAEYNLSLIEYYTTEKAVSAESCYMMGIIQIEEGYKGARSSGVLIGFGALGTLIFSSSMTLMLSKKGD